MALGRMLDTHTSAVRNRRRRASAPAGCFRSSESERLFLLRSEEHTSELQSLMRISYAVFCLKKKNNKTSKHINQTQQRTNRYTIKQNNTKPQMINQARR